MNILYAEEKGIFSFNSRAKLQGWLLKSTCKKYKTSLAGCVACPVSNLF